MRSPCLEMRPGRCLPPVPWSRPVSPIQAAKSRPLRNTFASGTLANTVLVMIGPTPGTSISRRAWRSPRAALAICCSRARSSASSACQCRANISSALRITSGMSSLGASSLVISCRNPSHPLGRHDPKVAQAGPQRVRCHGALPDQQRAGGVNSHRGLLLHALHRNEPHRRTADRLADPFGVPAIVLVALHIGLHVSRRHQSYLVAITPDYPRPVVRAATGLNAHRARRKLRKELPHGAAAKLTPQHHFSRSIDCVNLEHVLRQIQTDYANLAHGRPPCLVESISPVWHIDAVGGRPPHHCEEPLRRSNPFFLCGSMDCFASLAMTAVGTYQ